MQGPVCSGWFMRFLRHCSQKLWQGDGTSEPVSDIEARSPPQLTGSLIFPNPAGCGGLCHLGEPIPTSMPRSQQRRGRSPTAMPSPAQGAEQRKHPALILLWPRLGYG